MTINVHIAAHDPAMSPVADRLTQLVQTAVAWVERRLKLGNLDIFIHRNPMAIISETGVCGYSPTASLAMLSVDPANENFSKCLDIEVPATIVHELHHCSRWATPGYGMTLKEALVTEGLAQHFETDYRGGVPPFYAAALSSQMLAKVEEQARKEYDSQSYSHSDWFFGSSAREIPRHAGYSLGYELVGRFLRATGKDAAALCNGPASSFSE